MRLFKTMQVREAMDYGDNGGQALHIWTPTPFEKKMRGVPLCFKQSDKWAHLIDMDSARLEKTAKSFGVLRIKISRIGRRGQHIDLCGKPLEKAMEMCR